MTTYSISKLARQFHLSRSTLLYYDRIGLLQPSGRSTAGYRIYTETEKERLQEICTYREAGLSLEAIKRLLSEDAAQPPELRKRLQAIGEEVIQLKAQQHLIAAMLKLNNSTEHRVVDKAMWVSMLEAAGMDEAAMKQWHAEFERRAPEAHEEFLFSLGIDKDEVGRIRHWCLEEG